MLDAQSKYARIALLVSVLVILMVPIIRVVPELDTYIHPWRPEMVSGILLAGFCIWALIDRKLPSFIADLATAEIVGIILPMIAFIVWSGLSAIWADSRPSVLHHTGIWLIYLGFYLLVRYLTRGRDAQDAMIIALMAFVGMICLPPVTEYFGVVAGGNSATTLGLRYSKYTEIANTILPLIAAFAVTKRGWWRIAAIASVALIGVFDVASFSRTGTGMYAIVMIGFSAIVFVVPTLRQYRKATAVMLAVSIMVVVGSNFAVTMLTGSSPMVERINSTSAVESVQIRPFFRSIASQMIRTHPLTGIGADNFGQEFVEYRKQYAARNPSDERLGLADDALAERAHNEYFQIAAELGIVGIGIFALFVCGLVYAGIHIFRRKFRVSIVTLASFIGIAAFLSSSFFTSYSFAQQIDPENATLAMTHGLDLLGNKQFGEAAKQIRLSIDAGKASVIEYSYLATAQILADDRAAAEATVREALEAYPYSTFMHARLAAILSESGRESEAQVEMGRARSINASEAATWWNYLTMGGVKATKIAFDEKLTPLMDLRPGQGVYAIRTERELRFPEEKVAIPPPPAE